MRGAALYEREFKRETKVLAPDPKGLRNQHVRELPEQVGAGVVLHSDLDEKARSFRSPPTDLLQIGPWLANDLRTHGKRRLLVGLPTMGPFGELLIEGAISRDQAGVETMRLDIGPKPPAKRNERGPRPGCELSAQMTIVRVVDAEQGIVTRFDNAFTGEMFFPGRANADQIQRASFTVTDNWKLREVVDNRGARWNARVALAIRSGTAVLKKVLEADLEKKYDPEPASNGQTRPTGELALLLLTLLKAGESKHDPIVKKALDELRKRHVGDTYSLGVALLAMEACYTPASERDAMLAGTLSEPYPRVPTEDDRKIIEEWVQTLLRNRSDREAEGTSWHYTGGPSFDNSCSQYAVLGLYAAHLCGVVVEREIWIDAARHFLREQCEGTEELRVNLTTHQQLEKQRRGRGTRSATTARGWSYTDRGRNPTGSMTTAGIGSLTICDAVLRGMKRRPKDVASPELRGAMNSGFAWLSSRYDLRANPGAAASWRLYYLYGLERVCELNQIAHIEDKDWYFDGATLLLEEQEENGRWGDDISTCFAILFLKKAALPAITGRR